MVSGNIFSETGHIFLKNTIAFLVKKNQNLTTLVIVNKHESEEFGHDQCGVVDKMKLGLIKCFFLT